MYFCVRQDRGKAVDILVKDLKVFASFNEELYKEITQLLTLENFRYFGEREVDTYILDSIELFSISRCFGLTLFDITERTSNYLNMAIQSLREGSCFWS